MSSPDDFIYAKYELIFIVGTHANQSKQKEMGPKTKTRRGFDFDARVFVGSHTTAALQRSAGLGTKAHLEEPMTRVQNIR